MDPLNGNSAPIQLSSQELISIEQYRRLKETSVLVILFTDIKGFTRITEDKGEQYSQLMRKLHDEILVSTIEEDRAGLVIKYIGDSVMAVFSEPSTAVAQALKIQEKIRQFNETHPELENILVRIGLHMGQVSVENTTQLDLFGRHVNRASRVESLADGGQIFLTYPVFDSAKGWLQSQAAAHLIWKLHGQYYLKGIEAPVEIYEVVDSRYQQPRPPLNARKKSSLPPLWISAACLLLGVALTFGIFQFKRTEVWVVGWYPQETIIDQKETMTLDGTKDQETRRVLNKIPVGKHLLHYDINYLNKYFMETEVKRGKNYLKPAFKENYLPALSRRLDYTKATPSVEAQQDYTYCFYDKNNQRIDNKARITLSIQGQDDPKDRDLVIFTYQWQVTLNGKIISQNKTSLQNKRSNPESLKKSTLLYEDAYQYWNLTQFISRDSSELSIEAPYIEYKDK
jgi:class 3 adenylate cyclase